MTPNHGPTQEGIVFKPLYPLRMRFSVYIYPTRTVQYDDVTDFTVRGLVAKHGGIPLANLKNRADFEKIIKRLVAQNKIHLKK